MCQDYLLDAYLPEIYALIGSLVITIINNIVKKLLIKLGNFSRYKTLSHESSSLMATIFIAQIINTAIIPILVTYRYKDYIPTAMFSKILYLKFVDTKEENYTDDLNRQWYLQVGLKYMMAFLIMIFNPYLINFFLTNPFSICWRKWRFKKAVIHKEAKKYSHGPTFQLTQKYANALSLIFITMTFGSGIPILYLVSCIIFTITFLYQKYNLLRISSKPPQLDDQLNTQFIGLLPYAVFTHLIFAILMFSSPAIFPHIYVNEKPTDGIVKKLLRRLDHPNSLEYKYLLWLLVIIFLFFKVFLIIIGWFLQTFCSCFNKCFGNDLPDFAEGQGSYTKEIQTIKNSGLETYDITANEKYKELVQALIKFVDENKNEDEYYNNTQDDF